MIPPRVATQTLSALMHAKTLRLRRMSRLHVRSKEFGGRLAALSRVMATKGFAVLLALQSGSLMPAMLAALTCVVVGGAETYRRLVR